MTRNPQTVELAYQESVVAAQTLAGWYEKLDGKVVTVFGVAQVITALVPAITTAHPVGAQVLPWLGAFLAWAIAVVACIVAFVPRTYRLDPNPSVLSDLQWLTIDPDEFRKHRLEDVARTYVVNRAAYRIRTCALTTAIVATAVEVACIGGALLLGAR